MFSVHVSRRRNYRQIYHYKLYTSTGPPKDPGHEIIFLNIHTRYGVKISRRRYDTAVIYQFVITPLDRVLQFETCDILTWNFTLDLRYFSVSCRDIWPVCRQNRKKYVSVNCFTGAVYLHPISVVYHTSWCLLFQACSTYFNKLFTYLNCIYESRLSTSDDLKIFVRSIKEYAKKPVNDHLLRLRLQRQS